MALLSIIGEDRFYMMDDLCQETKRNNAETEIATIQGYEDVFQRRW